MIVYPNAKINLGLNILRKREDGFHNINSIFYPLYILTDILEIIESDKFIFNTSGLPISEGENLCVQAWKLLKKDFDIGNVNIHLHKRIPLGSGLGGGSSNASFTLRLLNSIFNLDLSNIELEEYAIKIGSDCPFFIDNTPKIVQGKGKDMRKVNLDLSDFRIKLEYPNLFISTKKAYSKVIPREPLMLSEDIIHLSIKDWKGKLRNDFEDSIFLIFPEIKKIKKKLYDQGAIYCSMTGSGSAVYAIFEK